MPHAAFVKAGAPIIERVDSAVAKMRKVTPVFFIGIVPYQNFSIYWQVRQRLGLGPSITTFIPKIRIAAYLPSIVNAKLPPENLTRTEKSKAFSNVYNKAPSKS